MFDDPIVAETHRTRDAYAASFGYDLGKIVSDLKSRQGKDGRRVVDRTSREQSAGSEASSPPHADIPEGLNASVAGHRKRQFGSAKRHDFDDS